MVMLYNREEGDIMNTKFDELKEKIYEQHKKDNYAVRLFEIAQSIPEGDLQEVSYGCYNEAQNYRYKGEAVNLFRLFLFFVEQRIKD